jgi:hypothetical protein
MELDWSRLGTYLLVVIAIYYALLWFTPLRRLPRERQFLVFGGIVFATLFVLGLVWP